MTTPDIVLKVDDAKRVAADFLTHWGITASDAAIVAEHLVENDRRGVASHGLLRLTQYAREIEDGEIDPHGKPVLRDFAAGPSIIEGSRCLGPVACSFALNELVARCRTQPIGVVTVRQAGHCGRIGAYTEALAEDGFIALAFCSGPRSGHRVAPFGAKEARLATNPIAYAFQTVDGVVSADFSTSAIPEGKARLWHNLHQEALPGSLRDARGRETRDPSVLYEEPPGTIQPLGGAFYGYKGTALGLLVEVLGTLYGGDDSTDALRVGNNVTLIALTPPKGFVDNASRLATYIKSAAPIDSKNPVLLPGDVEKSCRTGSDVHIARSTWEKILNAGRDKGFVLSLPREMA